VSRSLAVLLAPLVPDLSARMLSQLGQPALVSGGVRETGDCTTKGAGSTWNPVRQWGLLRSGDPLPEPVPVMQRLELESPL